MKSTENTKAVYIRTVINYSISIFWSLIYLTPVLYFSYKYIDQIWIYIILGIASLVYFIPNKVIEKFQAGNTTVFYRKIGIRLVRRFTQDGDLVNKLVRNKTPEYRSGMKSFRGLRRKFIFLEKFHYHFFLYFLFAMVYALFIQQYLWAAIILLCNIIFNVYPILLQQYNRLRLGRKMAIKTEETKF